MGLLYKDHQRPLNIIWLKSIFATLVLHKRNHNQAISKQVHTFLIFTAMAVYPPYAHDSHFIIIIDFMRENNF